MEKILITLSLAMLFGSVDLAAKTYKWIDDAGNVVYSQQPPPDNRETVRIGAPPPPAESPEEANKRLQEQMQRFESTREEKKAAREEATSTRVDAEKKAENCRNARANLQTLQNSPAARRFKTESGEYRKYTSEERAAKIKETEQQIETFCD